MFCSSEESAPLLTAVFCCWLLQDALDKIVPEGSHYRHLDEGYDDMPAHVKVCSRGYCFGGVAVLTASGRIRGGFVVFALRCGSSSVV